MSVSCDGVMCNKEKDMVSVDDVRIVVGGLGFFLREELLEEIATNVNEELDGHGNDNFTEVIETVTYRMYHCNDLI